MGMGAEFLFTADGGGGSMRAYLVRGMAYVTVIYEGQTTPIVTSTHAFVEINGKVRASHFLVDYLNLFEEGVLNPRGGKIVLCKRDDDENFISVVWSGRDVAVNVNASTRKFLTWERFGSLRAEHRRQSFHFRRHLRAEIERWEHLVPVRGEQRDRRKCHVPIRANLVGESKQV